MWNSCLDGMRILFPDVIQTIMFLSNKKLCFTRRQRYSFKTFQCQYGARYPTHRSIDVHLYDFIAADIPDIRYVNGYGDRFPRTDDTLVNSQP